MTQTSRILDTMPAFEAFARKASVESPLRREFLWNDLYRASHPEVFAGVEEAVPEFATGVPAMVRELSRIRARAKEAAPAMRAIIEDIDPKIAALLHTETDPSPLHVLMVGAFTTNSAVGRLGDEIAVFHCVEWFQTADGARALIAHEAGHAWHQLALRRAGQTAPPDHDLPWMIFSEGLATQISRAVAPNLAEVDYFWYGHPQMDDWVPWCEDHADDLRHQMVTAMEVPDAVETFFGAGFVEGRWRVGYHVADRLVATVGLDLPELAALAVADARQLVIEALRSP